MRGPHSDHKEVRRRNSQRLLMGTKVGKTRPTIWVVFILGPRGLCEPLQFKIYAFCTKRPKWGGNLLLSVTGTLCSHDKLMVSWTSCSVKFHTILNHQCPDISLNSVD